MENLMISEDIKKFKVENIEKYEEMIDEIEQGIADIRLSLGRHILFCSITLLFVGFSLRDSNYFSALWSGIITLIGGSVLDEKLYKLFELINEKKGYKNDLNIIKDKLGLHKESGKQKIK